MKTLPALGDRVCIAGQVVNVRGVDREIAYMGAMLRLDGDGQAMDTSILNIELLPDLESLADHELGMALVDGSKIIVEKAEYEDLQQKAVQLEQLLSASLAEPGATVEPEPPKTAYAIAGIGQPEIELLISSGFETVEKLAAATDKELLAVKGIGPKTVAIIRDALSDE